MSEIFHNIFLKDQTVKVKVKSLSRLRLFATLWTVAYQAPLSMEFSRQEYWSALPFPSPGDRGTWWVTMHEVTKSQTCLSSLAVYIC